MPENGLNTEASATLVSQVGNAWEKIKQEEKQIFTHKVAVNLLMTVKNSSYYQRQTVVLYYPFSLRQTNLYMTL